MAFSAGTYTLPGAALNTGDTVSATENNTLRNDMAGAFNKTLLRDGTATATGNIPMGGFKHTGLAAGSTAGDSVRFEQLPSATNVLAEGSGGTGTTVGHNGFKNRIINGAMMIDQHNEGAPVTVNADADFYPVDRLVARGQGSDGVFTAQQTAVSFATFGFTQSVKCTVTTADASIGAVQYYFLSQRIEGLNVADLGWGTASAKSVTLSFVVQSSVTGTYGGCISNSGNSRSYPFTYTISSANTPTNISVTIAGDTSGTWLTTNGVGMYVYFGLGVGSTYSGAAGSWAGATYLSATGATNWISTNGATFYITGVQLEKGSTATSFDYRPYGTELALCQRYCFRIDSASSHFCMAYADTTTVGYGTVFFPVQMRSTSGMALTTTGTYSNYTLGMAGVGYTVTGMNLWSATVNDAQLQIGVASGLTAGRAGSLGANTTAFLMFTSEL